MAHELATNANGTASIFYVGARPWHGLGTEGTAATPLPEIIRHAGLDWEAIPAVVRYAAPAPVTDANPHGRILKTVPDRRVIMRSDTCAPLGIVSDSYQIVQPAEIFALVARLLSADGSGTHIETAMALRGGAQMVVTARLGDDVEIAGPADKVRPYLAVWTAVDGSMRTEADLRQTRIVCANTRRIAASEGKMAYSLSHKSVFDPAEAVRRIGIMRKEWAADVALSRRMTHVDLTREQREAFVVSALDPKAVNLATGKADGKAIDTVRESAAYRQIMGLFLTGRGARLDGVQGTVWGALNAITEYVDHHARARTEENRFLSAQQGPGAALKDRAAELAGLLIAA